jgi:hydrogenase maturation protein HypF
LLGLCAVNDYEGEAAARLEALAARHADDGSAAWPEVTLPVSGCELPHRALLLAAAARCLRGEDPARIAFGLHRTFASLWVRLVQRQLPGRRTIGLGGGCLVNRLLRHELTRAFAAIGCSPLLPRALPPGDGGLAYGQCVVAAVARARNCEPLFSTLPSEP